MVRLLRHRPTKGPATARPHLHRRATSRLHISSAPASQAQQIPPVVVQQLADHAEKTNPSIVDSLSNSYAQHTTLVKTLGGGAVTIALAKIAERHHQAPR